MQKTYTWDYKIEIPPYDKTLQVVEAFFCSYPDGDYTCETRERYKLEFRRGRWKRSLMKLGDWVPDRLVPGQFNRWPIRVRVLARPSPETYLLSVAYYVCLPKSMSELDDKVQASVDQHIRVELDELAGYLAECIGLDNIPEIKTD